MFKKLFASMGFGSAEVNTHLNNNSCYPGGTISGVTHVKGGSVDLDIDDLFINLVAKVKRPSGDSYYYEDITFAKLKLTDKFKLPAGSTRELPFTLTVPHEAPITRYQGFSFGSGAPVGIRTALDIDDAVDKYDFDQVNIDPNPAMTRFLQAVDQLGFRLKKVDLEYGVIRGGTLPFYQELEYSAYNTRYSGRVNELEVTFIGKPNTCEVVLEIDKRTGFGGSSRDVFRRVYIDYNNYQNVDFVAEIDRAINS
ncbi:MAG: sporulation protein [Cytophagales bacterium]|nr:MAG: sporulation protein [Cytophagales bacterium]TAF61671.1 MAG: sporulation protein [Cytophagales bacterium]